MFSFLANQKIAVRIALVLLLPVLGLLFYMGDAARTSYQASVATYKLVTLTEFAPKVSNLVHELQKERGRSAGFIGSKGKAFAASLPEQRTLTDQKLTAFMQALEDSQTQQFGPSFVAKIESAQSALSQLSDKRRMVDGLQLRVADMAGYYTPTIAKLLAITEEMLVLSHDDAVLNHISTYTAFLQAKERAGLERAMGAAGYGGGKFSKFTYLKFVRLIAMQDALIAQSLLHATDAEKASIGQALSGPVVAEVDRLREIALDSPYSNTLEGVPGSEWFAAITKKINLMKTVEDQLAQNLSQTAKQQATAAEKDMQLQLMIGVLTVLVVVSLALLVIRGITRPLSKMVGDMDELAQGNLAVQIDGQDRKDEIGNMAVAVQVFKDNAIENKRLEERAKEQEEEAQAQKRQARLDMAAEFEGSVGQVVESIASAAHQLQAAAEDMRGMATTASEQVDAIQMSSEQAAQNVQAVAAASEEFNASIEEINRQVHHSNTSVQSAVEQIAHTNDQISGLDEKANSIGEVLSLISDIADKTNLLALNATIEAARAGDAGKGFAVVASEVKNLANQTSRATDDIARHISSIQSETTMAVSAIAGIGEVIATLQSYAEEIDRAVDEQGAASSEITRNIADASQGSIEVAEAAARVSTAVQQTGASASEVQVTADSLSANADILRQEASRFLVTLREG